MSVVGRDITLNRLANSATVWQMYAGDCGM